MQSSLGVVFFCITIAPECVHTHIYIYTIFNSCFYSLTNIFVGYILVKHDIYTECIMHLKFVAECLQKDFVHFRFLLSIGVHNLSISLPFSHSIFSHHHFSLSFSLYFSFVFNSYAHLYMPRSHFKRIRANAYKNTRAWSFAHVSTFVVVLSVCVCKFSRVSSFPFYVIWFTSQFVT